MMHGVVTDMDRTETSLNVGILLQSFTFETTELNANGG